MSLVNDALQRAKQHTAQPAPPPSLQLRPLEPAITPVPHSIWKFPIVLTIIGIVAAALAVTGWLQRGQENEVRARSVAMVIPVSEPKAAAVPAAKLLEPLKVSNSTAVADSKVEVANLNTEAAAAIVPVPAPRPVPPKLQAIFFNKAQPSAMINGRTLVVGNRLGAFRIAAITANSATLVSDTATNILSFEE